MKQVLIFSFNAPTAHADINHLTFRERNGHIFAFYGISFGFKVWFSPWRARKTASILYRLPMSNLLEGSPKCGSKLNSTMFSRLSILYSPLLPIISNLAFGKLKASDCVPEIFKKSC